MPPEKASGFISGKPDEDGTLQIED